MNLSDKVLVTGASGLIGRAVLSTLIKKGYLQILAPSHADLDLIQQESVDRYFSTHKPKYIFHLAARVGGIHANATYPANFIYENTLMQSNIFESAHRYGAQKVLFPGSACTYPKLASQPVSEEQLGTGPIEITNIAYGTAKLNGIYMAKSYYTQYGLPCIVPMPTNTYGIGDNFDPNSSHVIPALMRRMHEAKQESADEVVLWGTGTPLREFIYSEDVANAFVFLMNEYDDNMHINVGTMDEISIKELATLIGNIVGYQGNIRFDTTKPDGAPRKILNSQRLRGLGWQPSTSLEQGLAMMYTHHFINGQH